MGKTIQNGNYCVYIHTSPSGKMYVGQTSKEPENRWGKDGSGYLRKYKKNGEYKQPAFAHAIIKYGWDNFNHNIIAENLTENEANSFEKLLIEKLNTMNSKYGYNLKGGGDNGCLSDDTKRRISDATKGENHYLYGKQRSEETKKKISEGHKGLYAGTKHHNARKVVQYDLQGKPIKVWSYMKEAGEKLEINHHNIYMCCKGKRRTCGGFIWRYYEDKITNEYLTWCNEVPHRTHHKRCVVQYSLSGEFIQVFDSIKNAELETGVASSGISICCNGNRNAAGGFIWRYYDDIKKIA